MHSEVHSVSSVRKKKLAACLHLAFVKKPDNLTNCKVRITPDASGATAYQWHRKIVTGRIYSSINQQLIHHKT